MAAKSTNETPKDKLRTISSPSAGQLLELGPPYIWNCTGTADNRTTQVHLAIYNSNVTEIPTTHPGYSHTADQLGGDGSWSKQLQVNADNDGEGNILAVWYEYNGQNPDSLHTVFFTAVHRA